ncbi:pentapeptide repeat-containing protein [Streptomyces ferrugineus]|uniref:Pentapeptide repeat-containing protein n=1 Tax=Streptomyces ferrugineus TaxID=1413221 RepID=A0A7M2SD42_9ACTN|nr:pentapeptide repeat-containing protein [Streptomyces ferrugineus]QOV34234.1 pentapeptide repeat-containing protein [Streptomyces ferrugineus]
MEINDLTPAELRVWQAFPKGEAVDFRDAADQRTVRAAVLRALLLDGPVVSGEVAALKVAGARVTGVLDLRYATVESVVRLSHCHFEDVPDLSGAQLKYLNLSGSRLPGLASARIRVDGGLRLTDCRFTGPVRLGGAQIAGALYLEGAEITAPEGTADPVLQLHQATVGEDLCASRLRTRGESRLDGATISGSLRLEDADLRHPGGFVLNAEALEVGANVLGRRLSSQGRIDMRGARIPGRLDLLSSRLSNPGGTAMRASSCVIGEVWLRRGPRIEGMLNLRRSQIEHLNLEPEMLPDQVRILDLTYTSLTPHVPPEQRLPMLERDEGRFDPHGYEQLTASYRRTGDDHAARLVQLAKQRRHRTTLPWYGRLWGRVQDATVGYGFRPMRALGWLLSLLAVGSVTFALHAPAPLKPDEAPHFNPVFYTLDLLLPVISFGQEPAFAPDGGQQWLSYVLVLAGWILATTVIAGVTRTVSRQ